ncbi:MAG TPA: fused MFS/spermidine synthase, partial [Verrucomicrobiae bacterium]|nr:fused MFS/spermidine synthase [Verrucomicrobiae bacterium]
MKKQPPAATVQGMASGLRRYLYFTAAVTGAAIMIVEILGAKMLAPYVGTSHFVWTAQIAVTLMALAAGYFVGGWLVDRSPRLTRLYGAILVAAAYLCVTVLAVGPVAYWCLQFKLALGSLLASAFLFFVPLSLLAMVGPFFIRVLTSSVSSVGGNVGRLTALSTLGSFVGTLLIGYVLIPFLPNSWTMYLTAGLLFGVVAVYFLVWEKKSRDRPAVAAGVLAGLFIGFIGVRKDSRSIFSNSTEIFRGNSNFGQLQVVDAGSGARRYYLNDYLVQNIYDPAEQQSTTLFTYMLHDLARAYAPRIESALCIGLGVGVVPTRLGSEGIRVDVVEINPAVVPLGERYFGSQPNRFNLFIGDGRHFVNATTNRYDVIVLDAFLGDSSPSHLMTRESFDAMRRIMNPGGVLVINCFADFNSGTDFFGASLDKTLKHVFPGVRIHAAGNGNVFFVASNREELRILRSPDFNRVHASCRDQARAAFAGIVEANPRSGIVLTDDYNPVEFYDAANRERIRR